ncbi:Altered inheritance of mitochondria protein 6 [Pleurostoma richardsiae]|uniref:Altered inheritance of mitochondria protein 6 n=1 Tax=Pleurostoma richardsiae TaxID=41990 RepID=A0AA38VUJ0_9PEZI|nr:Altered inheritance of mitochondria protein 6 [Pleurostoma richardsiae]
MAHLLGLGGSSSKVVVEVKGYEPLEEDNGDDGSEFSYSLDEDISVSKRPKRLRSACFKCGTVFGITITILVLMLHLLYVIGRWLWGLDPEEQKDVFPEWGQPGTGTEDVAWYPTDFLRDVLPKACHSHNDYWRRIPLFSALHAGCIGVEADVWWFDDDRHRDHLYIGHHPAALQRKRTFESLYINPLVKILERQNPSTEFYNDTSRGVFDTDPSQSLTLLVDVKTDGASTWPMVVEQLEPLRERGWLSVFDNGKVRYGPITVVGTGNAPFDQIIQNSTYRDVFFDAPLDKLEGSSFDTSNSHYASVSLRHAVGQVWPGGLTPAQLETIRNQIRQAHERGLKARYWSLPAWPINARNHIWQVLEEEGIDLLNVDDLKGATKKDWTKVWHARA